MRQTRALMLGCRKTGSDNLGTRWKLKLAITAIMLMAGAMSVLNLFVGKSDIDVYRQRQSSALALATEGRIEEAIAIALPMESGPPIIVRSYPGVYDIGPMLPSMLGSVMHILVEKRGAAGTVDFIARHEADRTMSRVDIDTLRRYAAPAIARTGEIETVTAVATAIHAQEKRDSALLESGWGITANYDIDAGLQIMSLASNSLGRIDNSTSAASVYRAAGNLNSWGRIMWYALESASAIQDPGSRDEGLTIVARTYIEAGEFENARKIAPSLFSEGNGKSLLALIAEAQAGAGLLEDALATADSIGGEEANIARLKISAPSLIAEGRIDELASEILSLTAGASRDALLLDLLPDPNAPEMPPGDPKAVYRIVELIADADEREAAIICQATLQAARGDLASAHSIMALADKKKTGLGTTLQLWAASLFGSNSCPLYIY